MSMDDADAGFAYTTRRVALKGYPWDALLDEFAAAHRWIRVDDYFEDPHPQPEHFRHIIWSVRDDIDFDYVEDRYMNLCCMFARGDEPEAVEQVLSEATQRLPVWTDEELLHEFDTTTGLRRRQMVVIMGFGASERYDEGRFTRIAAALRSEDPKLRLFAVVAVTYAAWPEFLPLLTSLADHDPDETVRLRAQGARRLVIRQEEQA